MRAIVDRIENGIAVIETHAGMIDVPAIDGLRDGDMVELENNTIVAIHREEADARRAKLQARLDRMMKKK